MKRGFILPSDFVRNTPKLWWDTDLENNIKFLIDQEKYILGKRLEKTDGTIELQLKMELSKEIISLFEKEFDIKVL